VLMPVPLVTGVPIADDHSLLRSGPRRLLDA
jgi:hypothetical protein